MPAVPSEMVGLKIIVEEFPVQGTHPLEHCESSSYVCCCDFGVPGDFGQGSTATCFSWFRGNVTVCGTTVRSIQTVQRTEDVPQIQCPFPEVGVQVEIQMSQKNRCREVLHFHKFLKRELAVIMFPDWIRSGF